MNPGLTDLLRAARSFKDKEKQILRVSGNFRDDQRHEAGSEFRCQAEKEAAAAGGAQTAAWHGGGENPSGAFQQPALGSRSSGTRTRSGPTRTSPAEQRGTESPHESRSPRHLGGGARSRTQAHTHTHTRAREVYTRLTRTSWRMLSMSTRTMTSSGSSLNNHLTKCSSNYLVVPMSPNTHGKCKPL